MPRENFSRVLCILVVLSRRKSEKKVRNRIGSNYTMFCLLKIKAHIHTHVKRKLLYILLLLRTRKLASVLQREKGQFTYIHVTVRLLCILKTLGAT